MRRLSSKGLFDDFGSLIWFIIIATFIIIGLYVANFNDSSSQEVVTRVQANTINGFMETKNVLSYPIASCQAGSAFWPSELDASSWTVGDTLRFVLENAPLVQVQENFDGKLFAAIPDRSQLSYVVSELFPTDITALVPEASNSVLYFYTLHQSSCPRCLGMVRTVSYCLEKVYKAQGVDVSLGLQSQRNKVAPLIINKRSFDSPNFLSSVFFIPLSDNNKGLLIAVGKNQQSSKAAGEGYLI